ncbi:MAG: beta-N-acetylglucosaminidase [Flavobacterium sp. BFFFF2]|nr:MAG: beta-N-acetylglucosaminidase [Flavobacterium sp. BFFFF2]
MKWIWKWFIVLVVGVVFYNCASKKSISSTVDMPKRALQTKITIPQPDLSREDDYVPQLKSQRKIFFPDTEAEKHWVDSVYNQLSQDEKIGQLFMVAAYSNKDTTHIKAVEKLITQNHIGGLIFFQGGPVRQARLTNRYQALSKVPLFVGIDAEWGLSMRLDSTYKYPWNMTLGAIRDVKWIEKVGVQMGAESKRLGIHFNFAPVVDINTNPKNPIIGNRSFGESKIQVTEHALALMRGVQSQGVFSTGKHFPGHGDTSSDSHHTLPLVTASRSHLDLIELYPYKRLIDEGLVSIMVAHLNVPELEPRDQMPTSVSPAVVTDLLQRDLGFDGLIFTDALNMKGAANFKKPGELDLDAFKAGNDILLFAENVPVAMEKICMALQDSVISKSRLEESVRKILRYKYKAGLHHRQPIETKNLVEDLNNPTKEALLYSLFEQSVTVLKRDKHCLPIRSLKKKFAYVKLGDDNHLHFLNTLRNYAQIDEVYHANLDSLQAKLAGYDQVIIGYHKSDKAWKKHDFTDNEIAIIQSLSHKNHVILDVFAKPYTLLQLPHFDDLKGLVLSYQNHEIAQTVSAEIIFGALGSKGQLPVSIGDTFHAGDGLLTDSLARLGYTSPENVGMNSAVLKKIEAVAQKAISEKMAPGMQILVARKGKVIYNKAFGTQSYESNQKVTVTDLYDVASLTKMMGTLPLVMQLYDHHKVHLDTKLDQMLSYYKGSNKEHINFKDLLTHQAQLPAWIPFYKATLDSLQFPNPLFYRTTSEPGFSKQVSAKLFIADSYHDTIQKRIRDVALLPKKEYKYSDLTFYLLKDWIEKEYKAPLDSLVQSHFYQSMGMQHSGYNPLHRFKADEIVPTEIDTYFRHDTIRGYVHDMGAAMLGGVAGHAGVFSNAMDVAKMLQLFLQKGTYGDETYFSPETFAAFNQCYFCPEGNRRGLGFDKPQLTKEGPTCGCVSRNSFGHTGFTGTIAWADPDSEIIYVFLSNRTYPDSTQPNRLSKANIREEIQQLIQDAKIN